MEASLTKKGFDTMLSTIPEPAFNEIWCSKKGLEKLKNLIKIPGTSVYKKIDYMSFLVTPVRVRDYIADDKLFLMKKQVMRCVGSIITESCRLVQIIEIVEK